MQHSGRAVTEIHDSVTDVWATIINPDNDPPSISKVGHFDVGSQRKRFVRRSQLEHVEIFPAGRSPAVKLFAVPGGEPDLVGLVFRLPNLSYCCS